MTQARAEARSYAIIVVLVDSVVVEVHVVGSRSLVAEGGGAVSVPLTSPTRRFARRLPAFHRVPTSLSHFPL